MPLAPGKENVGKNIQTEEEAGKPRDQAIAIALHVAGESKEQTGHGGGAHARQTHHYNGHGESR